MGVFFSLDFKNWKHCIDELNILNPVEYPLIKCGIILQAEAEKDPELGKKRYVALSLLTVFIVCS